MKRKMNLFILFAIALLRSAFAGLIILPENSDKITAFIGDQFVLTCTSTGSAEERPKSLQWKSSIIGQYTDDLSQRVFTKLTGDSNTLFFDKLIGDDSGIYTCTGIESGNPIEKSVELVLRKRITFINTPEKQSIKAGTTSQLIVCRAEAVPGPEISWFRTGIALKNEYSRKYLIVNDEKYQITNDGLIIKNPQTEDEGAYICQAMVTQTGQAAKKDIDVQIITLPKWVQSPQDTEGVRGQDVIIRCEATAKPPPIVEFRKNDIPVAGERYSVQGTLLTIRRLDNSDAATYTCVAQNEAGSIVANLRLTVLVGPVLAPIEPLIIAENQMALFRCQAVEAIPPPQFKWKYADTEQYLDAKLDGRFSITNTDMASELRIENVRKSDARNYTCVATNKALTSERTGILFVKYSPVFIVNSEARSQYYSWLFVDETGQSRGYPIIFTCIANGYPQVSIKWKFRSHTIIEGPKYRFLVTQDGYSQLEVNPKEISDFGVYNCEADNSVGKNTRDIPLLQATPPRTPPSYEKATLKPDTIGFNIRLPQGAESDGGIQIDSYQIEWKVSSMDWTKASKKVVSIDITNPQTILYADVTNLIPDTDYVFRIAASNKPGVGTWTSEINIKTPERRQPDPIRVLSKEDCGLSNKCIVEWTPEGNGGSPIKDYAIRWRRVYYKDAEGHHLDKYDQWTQTVVVPLGITKYELKDLAPNAYYEVDITARNEIGISPIQPYRLKTLYAPYGSHLDSSPRTNLALGIIIGSCVAGFFILLLVIDLCCYFTNQCGVIMSLKKCCGTNNKDSLIDDKSSRSDPIYKQKNSKHSSAYKEVPQNVN